MEGISLAALLLGFPELKKQEGGESVSGGVKNGDFSQLLLELIPAVEMKTASLPDVPAEAEKQDSERETSDDLQTLILSLQNQAIQPLIMQKERAMIVNEPGPHLEIKKDRQTEIQLKIQPKSHQQQEQILQKHFMAITSNVTAVEFPQLPVKVSNSPKAMIELDNAGLRFELPACEDILPVKISKEAASSEKRPVSQMLVQGERVELPEEQSIKSADSVIIGEKVDLTEDTDMDNPLKSPEARLEKEEVSFQPSPVENRAADIADIPFEQVKTEKPQVVAQDRPSPSRQLVDHLIARSQVIKEQQSTTITMQLKPEHLGRLEIVLKVENGILQGEIKVMDNYVRQSIEADLSQLKQSLADQGLKLGQITVTDLQNGLFQQFQQEGRERQQAFFRQAFRRSHRALFREEQDSPEIAEISLSQINYKA